MKVSLKNITYTFLFLFGLLLFIFGLGQNNFVYLVWTLLLVVAFLVFFSFLKKIVYPENFLEYKIFMIITAVSLSWSIYIGRSFYFLTLFVIAAIVWLIFYNAKNLGVNLAKIIIVLGLLFLGLNILNAAFGYNSVNSFSLYLPVTQERNHNHVGDFWVLIILIVLDALSRKSKNAWHILLIAFGGYALFISESRSAYLALAAGVFYIFRDKIKFEKYKFYLLTLGIAIVMLFLYAGAQKTLLFSRPYAVDVFKQILENPYGVGLGSFGIISRANQTSVGSYSAYTHNIFLELVSGIGVYSLAFVYWFYKIVKELFWDNPKYNLFKALFLAMTVNFLFDYTYFLPAMLFLWFAFLGLAQKKS